MPALSVKFGSQPLDLVIIGRSILSSSANPTANLYRGLINELAQHGHRTTFLEPYSAPASQQRDMLRSPYCEVWTYDSIDTLLSQYRLMVRSADLVMLGAGIEQTDRVAEWIAEEARGIKIYYDTDLARTAASMRAGNTETNCLSCRTVSNFNLFLSTTGGPALQSLAAEFGIGYARPLYESVDPFSFYRTDTDKTYDLGFIGNFKQERDKLIETLLLGPARTTPNRQFALAGDGYASDRKWPENLTYLPHLPETNHVDFYNRQTCTLVLSRNDRRRLGYTPSRRLLAAAACGTPIITDRWEGLEEFFEPGRELFPVANEQEVLDVLYGTDEVTRLRLGAAARARILAEHTTAHRAKQLLAYWDEISD